MKHRYTCCALLACLLVPAAAHADPDRQFRVALGAYITAAALDGSITSYCVGRGECREANPLLAPVVERHGVVAAMTLKGAFHGGILGILLSMHKERPKVALWTTIGLLAAQVAVDAHNVKTLRRTR